MALELKFIEFKQKYDLSDDALEEVKCLFNEAFIAVANSILTNKELKSTAESVKKEPKTESKKEPKAETKGDSIKKWASKIAEEFASENNLTLDDFPDDCGKITKKSIEQLVKSKNTTTKFTKTKSENTKSADTKSADTKSTDTKTKSNKESKLMCSGIKKDGTPCSRNGTDTPEGSKKSYCWRCAIEWKNYEVSSDSSEEESEEFSDNVVPDLAVVE
jgi:hypothetical protein